MVVVERWRLRRVLAVYLEGAETALFYQALFNEGNPCRPPDLARDSSLDFAGLAVHLHVVSTGSAFAFPLRQFFAVTSVLLYYMAFVFWAKAFVSSRKENAGADHGYPRNSRDPWKRWVSIPPGRRSWHSSFCLGSSCLL